MFIPHFLMWDVFYNFILWEEHLSSERKERSEEHASELQSPA